MDHSYDQQHHNYGAGLAGSAGGMFDRNDSDGQWREAFLRVAAAAGLSMQHSREPEPEAAEAAVAELRQSQGRLQELVRTLQQQQAALQVQVSHLTLQNLELRRELGSGWAAAEPSVVQVRQLVLDPAVQQEFGRLRRELEDAKIQIQQLQETNEGLTFTSETKIGRQLIDKTRLLADENEEMAAQLRAGPGATASALLALERSHAAELRKGLSELADHCCFLEEENEELNMLRFLNERQIGDQATEARAAEEAGRERDHPRGGGPGRDRDRDRDGRGGGGGRGGYGGGGGRRGRGGGGRDGGGRFSGHKRPR